MKRRLAATSAVLAGVAAVALAALAAAERGESEGAAKPRLSVDLAPLVVGGNGFRAGETVRVTVRGDAVASTRRAKASATGRIRVRFPGLRLEQCPGYLIITAKGDKGSRAQVRRVPPACGSDRGRVL
jgi:hypothetical protein